VQVWGFGATIERLPAIRADPCRSRVQASSNNDFTRAVIGSNLGIPRNYTEAIMLRLCTLQLTLLLICLIPDAAAQAPADLEEAMQRRSQAVLNADGATWDRYTADDFTVVLADGKLMNKRERLALMKTQKPRRSSSPEQVQIKHYGETYVRRFLGENGWVMEVWTKDKGGKWRVSAVQVTTAAQK
jgi:hypothetical protein